MPQLFDTIIGPFDPFVAETATQANRLRAYCQVTVAGIDITNKLDPHLISVRIHDEGAATCEIEIDDRDGRLPIPPILSTVTVNLGWKLESMERVFQGKIIEPVEHGFGRKQGGRRMWVHASGTDFLGTHLKTPIQDYLGDGAPPGQTQGQPHSLGDWLKQMGKNAGVNVQVDPQFESIMRDYWHQSASAMHEIAALAEKFGAVVRYTDNGVSFERLAARGNIVAKWRDNLIAWRVHPVVGKSSWGGASQQYYDHLLGQWKRINQQFGNVAPWSAAVGVLGLPAPAPNQQNAQQDNQGQDEQAPFQSSTGRIVINGEPTAQQNGTVDLIGARPGVDGIYWIASVEHLYSRQGFVTFLEVRVRGTSANDAFLKGYGQSTQSGTGATSDAEVTGT